MYFSHQDWMLKKNRLCYKKMYDKEHVLVKIDRDINWNQIISFFRPYYHSKIGRPTVDPIIIVKILLIQYLEGFRSVRFTCKQVQQNYTYRWFLGISTDERIPNHSTISKFLHERLQNNDVWNKVFYYLLQCIYEEGYIATDTWAADETEIKANANKRKRVKQIEVIHEKEDKELLQKVNDKREKQGKKPLSIKEEKTKCKLINCSPTDPEARLSVKHDKRGRFAYYEHRIVDTLHNFIIATTITPANVHGPKVLLTQLDNLHQFFDVYPKEILLDAGYYQGKLAEELFARGIDPYISPRRFGKKTEYTCQTYQFKKVTDDLYACPCGIPFYYRNSTRQGYHEYIPPKGSCENCPCNKKGKEKVLRISAHQETYDRLRVLRLSDRGKTLRKLRAETVELSFAISKEFHGFRFARYRGILKVTFQALLTAIVQNLKKWTKLHELETFGSYLTYHFRE